jgi:hypothetical protein
MKHGLYRDLHNVLFVDHDTTTAFYNEFLYTLKNQELQEEWSCIILDPISRFLGDAYASHFIALLEGISLELAGKPTILFSHHMYASGFNELTDYVHWQANLEQVEKKDQEAKADVVKSKSTPLPPHMLQWVSLPSLKSFCLGLRCGLKNRSIGFLKGTLHFSKGKY